MDAVTSSGNSTSIGVAGVEKTLTETRALFITEHAHEISSLEKELEPLGYSLEVKQVATFDGLREAIYWYSPDIVLVELNLPGFDGIRALDYLKAERPGIPLIVISEQHPDVPGVYSVSEVNRLPGSIAGILQERKAKSAAKKEFEDAFSLNELAAISGEGDKPARSGIVVLGPDDLKIVYADKGFSELTGYSGNELLAMKNILRVIVSDDVTAFERMLKAGENPPGQNQHCYFRIVRKNGLISQLQVEIKFYEWNKNKRIAMIVIDKAGATALPAERKTGKMAEMNLHPTIGDTSAGFAVFDVDSDGKIQSWNPSAEALLGYTVSEALGTDFRRFLEEDNIAGSMPFGFPVDSSQEVLEFESLLSAKDGRQFKAEVTITRILNAAGEATGCSVYLKRVPDEILSEDKLREREAQLHSLASHLQKAHEEEKAFIARQLHDEFGQTLTALRMDLSILGRMISRTVSESLGRGSLLEKVSSVSEILEKAIRSAREMITELRPAVLDELGLLTAIQWQVLEFENRTGINCQITKLQHGETFDPTVSTTVFRILQEALDNVQRHSSATEAFISLDVVDSCLLLQVTDNGIGIETDKLKSPASIGIIGMRERVLALGGKLVVRGEAGRGTTLTVSIPHPDKGVVDGR